MNKGKNGHMKIVSLFLESFRVANKMGNARSRADMDSAEQQIAACCNEGSERDNTATVADGAGLFDRPLVKQA